MDIPIPYLPKKTPKIEFIPFDGLKFKTEFWEHATESKYIGRIVFVHGFAEDSKAYGKFFDDLSDLGFDIFFFDQRGAGETSLEKDHGRTNETLVFKDLEFIINYNLNELKKIGSNEKLILAGHLMGGGIVLNYGVHGKSRESIRSIIGLSPEVLLHPSTAPNFLLKAFSSFALKFLPNLRIDAGVNINFLSHDEKWRNYVAAHTKKFWITSPLFVGMLTRGENLTKKDYVSKFDPDIPVLVIHGTKDEVNWFDGSKKFIDALNDNVDKEFVPIEGGYHNLSMEINQYRDQLIKKITEFSNKH